MTTRRTLILLALVLTLALTVLAWPRLHLFIEVDSCLDAGGRWDSTTIPRDMHVTFFPEGLIVLAVYVTVAIVLWRVSARTAGWVRLALRGVALTMLTILVWNTVTFWIGVARLTAW
jgi:hypothetical protein